MSRIDKLITYVAESGHPTPAPEVIEKIHEIDEGVSDGDLVSMLAQIEKKNREDWSLGQALSWNTFEGTPYARPPEFDESGYTELERLQEAHRARYEMVVQIFADQGVVIEDGGIKSLDRVKKKLEYTSSYGRADCRDLSRARIVCPGLAGLENAYDRLLHNMPLQLRGMRNHYSTNLLKKYPTLFRGVSTNWFGMDEYSTEDIIATEVQLVTERVRTIMDIDHLFNVAQVLKYRDIETFHCVTGIMAKASILDFQERFAA